MAIDIPNWLEPFLELYGIPWPDIDEDAFHELKEPLHAFGEDLTSVADAIDSALTILEAGNPSQTLQAVSTYFGTVRTDFLNPITGTCDDLAGAPCDITYDAIVGVKLSLLSMLAGEIANDVVDVVATVATFGLDSALTVAEAIGVRDAVSQALTLAEGDVASALISSANQCLDNFVNSLVSPFIDSMSRGVESAVDSYAPTFLLQQAFAADQTGSAAQGAVAAKLHLSPSDLDQCVQSIVDSSTHLDQASQRLVTAMEEIFSHPAASPQVNSLSSEMRMAIKGVVNTIEADLVAALKNLLDHVAQHFVALLNDYKRSIDELDQQARDSASKQHARRGASVTVIAVAGVGVVAAGGVTAATGAINAREATQIQVGTAAAAADGQSVTGAVDTHTPNTAPATSSGDRASDLHTGSPRTSPTLTPEASSTGGVESLHTQHEGNNPHVSAAESAPTSATSVSTHHEEEHVRSVHDGSSVPPPVAGSHLDVKHPDGQVPKMTAAESSAHRVDDLEAKAPVDKPLVDQSSATEEAK